MIYTITFAPSIDYVINSNNKFISNGLNRVDDYDFFLGGKGINASIILKKFNIPNQIVTFFGGKTKSIFEFLLKQEKINLINFETKETTRINVKFSAPNAEFEINGQRPTITKIQFKKLLELFKTMTKKDYVFIMGTTDSKILKKLVKSLYDHQVNFVLDVDSPTVIELLKYQPLVIKPNMLEIKNYFNKEIKTINEIRATLVKLKKMGVLMPIISNGKNGSFILDESNKLIQALPPKLNKTVSASGSGDTLLTTFFIFYFIKKLSAKESLINATAMAAGTASRKWLALKSDLALYSPKVVLKSH